MSQSKINQQKKILFTTLKDKYPFLLIGLVVIFLLITSFVKLSNIKNIPIPTKVIQLDDKELQKTTLDRVKENVKTYIVQKGDHLWKIAENTYGSGYNAYDIAKANKLTNASMIFAGQKLTLPDIKPKEATVGEIAQAKTEQVVKKVTNYTVQEGDHLWKIATEVYGDGMTWSRIAKINNITNPDLIFKGQVLKIE